MALVLRVIIIQLIMDVNGMTHIVHNPLLVRYRVILQISHFTVHMKVGKI